MQITWLLGLTLACTALVACNGDDGERPEWCPGGSQLCLSDRAIEASEAIEVYVDSAYPPGSTIETCYMLIGDMPEDAPLDITPCQAAAEAGVTGDPRRFTIEDDGSLRFRIEPPQEQNPLAGFEPGAYALVLWGPGETELSDRELVGYFGVVDLSQFQ